MSEAYSSGVWLANEGEDDAFVEAWTEFEFRQRIAAVREHVTEFTPSEFELLAEV
jgi:hypothetical protein